MTKHITVSVIGSTAAGKTFVATVIEKALKEAGFFHVVHDFGPDGDPRRTEETHQRMLDEVAPLISVNITETQVLPG